MGSEKRAIITMMIKAIIMMMVVMIIIMIIKLVVHRLAFIANDQQLHYITLYYIILHYIAFILFSEIRGHWSGPELLKRGQEK